MKLTVTILTLFPEMFPGPFGCSLAGRALREKIWKLRIINIREFGLTKHKNVDAPMFGGGSMVLRPDVLGAALDQAIALCCVKPKILYPSPRGLILQQEGVKSLSKQTELIILCGRFEGIDERIIDEYDVEQISIGNYILSGGEIASFVILDSILRFVPGVLKNRINLKTESFEEERNGEKLIEHPLYTKPAIWREREVPDILLSGDHGKIEQWKQVESLKVTELRQNKARKREKFDL